MTRTVRRSFAALAAALLLSLVLVGCDDGRPAFCDDLAKVADLKGLRAALDGGDLAKARREAQKLKDLATDAPDDVRADLEQLTSAVADIVSLVAAGRSAGAAPPPSTAPQSSSTAPTTTVDPAELERRREDLNNRLSDLSEQSAKVGAWASRTCGLELG